ncbi:MAG: hypothetical protein HC812_18160 [Leptolyngbya sp. RL_3_1]|nr:hypothetical protein [Leptolyngbya sp. RL_3_1]
MSEFLSPLQRLELIRLVNALPSTEFDELLFALNPKDGVVPSNASAQGNRAKSLLTWIEGPTGCGLAMFLETLDAVAPGAFKVPARPLVNAAPAATLPAATLPIAAVSAATLAPQPSPLNPSAPGIIHRGFRGWRHPDPDRYP